MSRKRKPYERELTPLPLARFTYVKASKSLVAEASDLRYFGGLERLYDDAADVGLAVHNPTTGVTVRFSLSKEVRDDEGELRCWELIPVDACPTVERLTIFND